MERARQSTQSQILLGRDPLYPVNGFTRWPRKPNAGRVGPGARRAEQHRKFITPGAAAEETSSWIRGDGLVPGSATVESRDARREGPLLRFGGRSLSGGAAQVVATEGVEDEQPHSAGLRYGGRRGKHAGGGRTAAEDAAFGHR